MNWKKKLYTTCLRYDVTWGENRIYIAFLFLHKSREQNRHGSMYSKHISHRAVISPIGQDRLVQFRIAQHSRYTYTYPATHSIIRGLDSEVLSLKYVVFPPFIPLISPYVLPASFDFRLRCILFARGDSPRIGRLREPENDAQRRYTGPPTL